MFRPYCLLHRPRLVGRMQSSMSLISAHKIFASSASVVKGSHFIFAAMQKFYSWDTFGSSWFFNLFCTMETIRWGLLESETHPGNLPVSNAFRPQKKNSLADTRNISFWVSPLWWYMCRQFEYFKSCSPEEYVKAVLNTILDIFHQLHSTSTLQKSRTLELRRIDIDGGEFQLWVMYVSTFIG